MEGKCDVQQFDCLGHNKGDDLLKITAQRLQACTRKSDTVARLGGDEFTVILSQHEGINNVYHVLESTLNSIEQPFELENDKAYVTASTGVTFYSSDARDAEARTRLANELHQAMAKKQIWLAYQPIIELNTGRIVKAEALARWTHPNLGALALQSSFLLQKTLA